MKIGSIATKKVIPFGIVAVALIALIGLMLANTGLFAQEPPPPEEIDPGDEMTFTVAQFSRFMKDPDGRVNLEILRTTQDKPLLTRDGDILNVFTPEGMTTQGDYFSQVVIEPGEENAAQLARLQQEVETTGQEQLDRFKNLSKYKMFIDGADGEVVLRKIPGINIELNDANLERILREGVYRLYWEHEKRLITVPIKNPETGETVYQKKVVTDIRVKTNGIPLWAKEQEPTPTPSQEAEDTPVDQTEEDDDPSTWRLYEDVSGINEISDDILYDLGRFWEFISQNQQQSFVEHGMRAYTLSMQACWGEAIAECHTTSYDAHHVRVGPIHVVPGETNVVFAKIRTTVEGEGGNDMEPIEQFSVLIAEQTGTSSARFENVRALDKNGVQIGVASVFPNGDIVFANLLATDAQQHGPGTFGELVLTATVPQAAQENETIGLKVVELHGTDAFSRLQQYQVYGSGELATVVEPAVEVTSPPEGYFVSPGQDLEIKFDARKVGDGFQYGLSIFSTDSNLPNTTTIITQDAGNLGAYLWKVPADFPEGEYKILVDINNILSGGSEVYRGYSASFTIVAEDEPEEKTLQLVNPNGGQTFRMCSTQHIVWNSNGFPQGTVVTIILEHGVLGYDAVLAENISIDQPVTVKIPCDVPQDLLGFAGFQMLIIADEIKDHSDALFTILSDKEEG